MIRAKMALEVIWLPQVAPTNETFMSTGLMPNVCSSALATWPLTWGDSDLVWTVHPEGMSLLDMCWTVAEPPHASSTTREIAFWLVDEVDGNAKLEPPTNSWLKLSPLVSRETTLTSRMMPEIVYHIRWRPTKLMETSPRYSRCGRSRSRAIMPPARSWWRWPRSGFPLSDAGCAPSAGPRSATASWRRAAPGPARTSGAR